MRTLGGPFAEAPRAAVRAWAERMLAELGLVDSELSVLITNDEQIRRLNRDYRSKDRPTDVLAFAMLEGPGPERGEAGGLLGDVVISIETARRQARGRRLPCEAEIRMLLAHGLLHLVGYDHQTDSQERRMTRRTQTLCRVAAEVVADLPTKAAKTRRAQRRRSVRL